MQQKSDQVLIDTWWNVNVNPFLITLLAFVVLIDTWWNVNQLYFALTNEFLQSFNRYMVECK